MTEVMSIAVTDDDQWLVVNGRPVEYYAGDTAFVEGNKAWASERAARRLAEALSTDPLMVDFVLGGFPDAIVERPDGQKYVVHGAASLHDLGLNALDPTEIGEDELIILARELGERGRAGGQGVEPLEEPVPVGA
ncbi:MAG TPA: hypothetical protein VFB34_02680 [Chloroflexota bacterium]|nr:hypothetical protein [Chloroflexota bacterium]